MPGPAINASFLEHYRCPESFAAFALDGEPGEDSGYFRFGPGAICFGRCSSGFRAARATDELYDAMPDLAADSQMLQFPFNPSDIVENLRRERYASSSDGLARTLGVTTAVRTAYYLARPFLPVSVRKHLQKISLGNWGNIPFPSWPVDGTVERILEELMGLSLKAHAVDRIPFIWFWPNGSPSCAIVTHDVETVTGRDSCAQLMDWEDACGIKSSFQIVPEERYPVAERFLDTVRSRGFEINVHDLNHDGNLFSDRERFLRRAERINQYGRKFGANGFRSAALYRNLDWFDALDFSYDMSVPSIGHLEAQRGGCCSVTPFFVGRILELPVTTTQDYSLFHILGQYSIDLWKHQVALITEKHGLASFIIHPDYLGDQQALDTYKALAAYLAQLRLEENIWIALPGEVNEWWRARSRMRLTRVGNRWRIEGNGKEQARIAYAKLDGEGRVVYRLEDPVSATVDEIDRDPVSLSA